MKPTLNAEEAARFLNIDIGTLCERARAGKIPGAKEGRAWVFVTADLIQHIRSKYRQKFDGEGIPWGPAEKKVTPTLGASYSAIRRDYEKALAPAPAPKKRHKN